MSARLGLALAFACGAVAPACGDDGHDAPPVIGLEHTRATPILDASGLVVARGWARHPLFVFDRAAVPDARQDQIREWDFYAIHAPGFAVMVTLAEVRFADLGHFVIASVSIHDFARGDSRGQSLLLPDDGTLLDLLPTPGGNYTVSGPAGAISYGAGPAARSIVLSLDATPAADAAPDAPVDRIEGQLDITIPPHDESMALVTPFADPGTFFYENKVPAMPVTGSITLGERRYDLPAGASFAVMDWVRAVSPHTLDWTWAVGVGVVDGRRVGLNLGSVFGDESGGTPDAVVVDGVLNKLPPVAWTPPAAGAAATAAWRFASADGRVALTLTPNGYRESSDVDLGFYTTTLDKPYGTWSGTVVLDDGTTLVVDGLIGAAETSHTTW
ncbi:MAG: DUF2804 domain-containing protein [Myxococcota bacterium]